MSDIRISTKDGMPELIKVKDQTWAIINKKGELVKFDAALCKQSLPQQGTMSDHNALMANLVLLVLEASAKEVDHILKEGGGTYGDVIRNLKIYADIG